ncbi:glycosyltransferase [Glycomyces tarimensis]
MRVLLSTYGSRGDVEPLAGLAVQLLARGAEVLVCAPPDDDFERRLGEVGVPMAPVGPSARDLASGPRRSVPETAAILMASELEGVTAAAEGCDVLVATGLWPAAAGALSAAEKLGIRSKFATFQQVILPSPDRAPIALPGRPFPPDVTDNRVLWDLDVQFKNELFGPAVNTGRAAVGLPPVDNVRDWVFGDRPWLATDPVLDPWHGDIEVEQTGAWLLPDERALPDDLEAFLDAGTPPVYVGFGSMPWDTAKHAAQAAVQAVRAHGRRVVVSRGWAEVGLIEEGEDGFAVGEANHRKLFGRVAAVVHHGGAGTTTTAAAAGAPQVVVPQIADQPYWASRVAGLGIGAAHDGPTPTVATLSAALETALDPRTRTRARQVAAEIRPDGAEVAAKLLLDAD